MKESIIQISRNIPAQFTAKLAVAAIVTAILILIGAITLGALLVLPFLILEAICAYHAKDQKEATKTTIRVFLHWAVRPVTMITIFYAATSLLFWVHAYKIAGELTTPEEGEPWREGLTVRVYWNKPPTKGMENGIADTAEILGFSHEKVDSLEDANIRIWPDSWEYMCKWTTSAGFASLDPNPGALGSQTGDIHICKFTSPIKDHPITDYSTVAHETAHILAAQGHFGDGLMGVGGGNGSSWFNEMEIQKMCDKINEYHESVRTKKESLNGQTRQSILEHDIGSPPCGGK